MFNNNIVHDGKLKETSQISVDHLTLIHAYEYTSAILRVKLII